MHRTSNHPLGGKTKMNHIKDKKKKRKRNSISCWQVLILSKRTHFHISCLKRTTDLNENSLHSS